MVRIEVSASARRWPIAATRRVTAICLLIAQMGVHEAVSRPQGIVRSDMLLMLVVGWLSCSNGGCWGWKGGIFRPLQWDWLRSFDARASSNRARPNSSWKDQS